MHRLAFALLFVVSRAGAAPLAPDFPLPDVAVVSEATRIDTRFDQLEVVDARGATTRPRGHAVRAYLTYVPEGSTPPPAATTWAAWRPRLEQAGWKLVSDAGGVHYLSRGGGQWAVVRLADYQDPLVSLIVGPATPRALTFKPPAAAPEQVGEAADFPYLPAFPGAKLSGTGTSDIPFQVKRAGDQDAEVVALGQIEKSYTPPKDLSRLETELAYGAALRAAGWEVLPGTEGEGAVTAHYAKGARNIWLAVSRAADDSDRGLRYFVADVGADDWGKQLERDCRVTLVGVHFDFNKATLRPDSTAVLAKAAALIKAHPALALEVAGHTDAVGDGAYNDRLSQQRAEAVMAWLVGHGAAAGKLSARGYGKARPVADNDTDAGRAKNRRVELACKK